MRWPVIAWIINWSVDSSQGNKKWICHVSKRKAVTLTDLAVSGGTRGCHFRVTDHSHKSHNAPVPYPTMHHSEQKCAHFCSEWCIAGYQELITVISSWGYAIGALWDLWIWSIDCLPYRIQEVAAITQLFPDVCPTNSFMHENNCGSQHIQAWTRWLTFHKWHFQLYFVEWKLL